MLQGRRYSSNIGNSAAGWATVQFTYNGIAPPETFTARTVVVDCENNTLNIAFSCDGGVTFGDTIEVNPDDPPFPYPITATHFRHQNTVAAQISRYKIVGIDK